MTCCSVPILFSSHKLQYLLSLSIPFFRRYSIGRQCPEIPFAVKFLFSSGGRFESKYFSNWYFFILWYISVFKYYADEIVNPMTEMGHPQHISSIVGKKKSAFKRYIQFRHFQKLISRRFIRFSTKNSTPLTEKIYLATYCIIIYRPYIICKYSSHIAYLPVTVLQNSVYLLPANSCFI